jgi:hypothetical protein
MKEMKNLDQVKQPTKELLWFALLKAKKSHVNKPRVKIGSMNYVTQHPLVHHPLEISYDL